MQRSYIAKAREAWSFGFISWYFKRLLFATIYEQNRKNLFFLDGSTKGGKVKSA